MSAVKFKGVIVDVYHDHNGLHTIEQVKHPGGVCVAALTPSNTLLFVKQYRFGIEKDLLEFPAGLIEPDEAPHITALRELEEETGYKANHIQSLGTFYLSPGYSNEIIHLFYAEDLIKTQQNLDPFESLEVIELPFEEAINTSFKDIKTELLIQKIKSL